MIILNTGIYIIQYIYWNVKAIEANKTSYASSYSLWNSILCTFEYETNSIKENKLINTLNGTSIESSSSNFFSKGTNIDLNRHK